MPPESYRPASLFLILSLIFSACAERQPDTLSVDQLFEQIRSHAETVQTAHFTFVQESQAAGQEFAFEGEGYLKTPNLQHLVMRSKKPRRSRGMAATSFLAPGGSRPCAR